MVSTFDEKWSILLIWSFFLSSEDQSKTLDADKCGKVDLETGQGGADLAPSVELGDSLKTSDQEASDSSKVTDMEVDNESSNTEKESISTAPSGSLAGIIQLDSQKSQADGDKKPDSGSSATSLAVISVMTASECRNLVKVLVMGAKSVSQSLSVPIAASVESQKSSPLSVPCDSDIIEVLRHLLQYGKSYKWFMI